ncbi:hypothetical protein EYF80_064961 [Liparis tanakae]|uniref:Uncharacterized protein n=1 Tax=Liparis tanakae TaxID=230148 RepID=A0A4Z2E8B6_9TELE|nr:hypothetical protein EYF80_064961 [Liparis tanakae]
MRTGGGTLVGAGTPGTQEGGGASRIPTFLKSIFSFPRMMEKVERNVSPPAEPTFPELGSRSASLSRFPEQRAGGGKEVKP